MVSKKALSERDTINRTVGAIARGENRLLLVMATGTGKTYTAFQMRHSKTGPFAMQQSPCDHRTGRIEKKPVPTPKKQKVSIAIRSVEVIFSSLYLQ